MPLLDVDKDRVQFSPLHSFQSDEIIAYDKIKVIDGKDTGDSDGVEVDLNPSADQQLCYGIVVKDLGSNHGAVRRLLVQVSRDQRKSSESVISMLSSQVYMFAPTRIVTHSMNNYSSEDFAKRKSSRRGASGKQDHSRDSKPTAVAPASSVDEATVGSPVDANELIDAVHDILTA